MPLRGRVVCIVDRPEVGGAFISIDDNRFCRHAGLLAEPAGHRHIDV